jgi:hypothetical protein
VTQLKVDGKWVWTVHESDDSGEFGAAETKAKAKRAAEDAFYVRTGMKRPLSPEEQQRIADDLAACLRSQVYVGNVEFNVDANVDNVNKCVDEVYRRMGKTPGLAKCF